MLLGNFFDIQSFAGPVPDGDKQKYLAATRLNPGHEVYKGHFPGNPVVPGVCQIQMVKELVEKAVNQKLKLVSSDNIKFLALLNPDQSVLLDFQILIKSGEGGQLTATVSISAGDIIFLKFKGNFEIEK